MTATSGTRARTRGYRDLLVWQKAMNLAVAVAQVAHSLPAEEKYVLAQQMRRASVSIAGSIAEGTGRVTLRDCARFIAIARGSARELDTHFELARRLYNVRDDQMAAAESLLDEVLRMLTAMMRKLTPF